MATGNHENGGPFPLFLFRQAKEVFVMECPLAFCNVGKLLRYGI